MRTHYLELKQRQEKMGGANETENAKMSQASNSNKEEPKSYGDRGRNRKAGGLPESKTNEWGDINLRGSHMQIKR